jgi:hypothetical protein
VTFDYNRERIRKEQGAYDTLKQATVKYNSECKYNGSRHLTKEEINEYMKAVDKNKYLKSIGKFEMEECN